MVEFTDKQYSVVKMLADGYTYSEIATTLFMSEHSAKGHIRVVKQKLGAKTTPHIIALACRQGLITWDSTD